jgi:hypothetical protein
VVNNEKTRAIARRVFSRSVANGGAAGCGREERHGRSGFSVPLLVYHGEAIFNSLSTIKSEQMSQP